MNKKIGKFIEVIILIAGILLTVAVVVAIPLKSYYEYADYLEKLIELSKPEPKPVLESISVSLKEGVQYFENELAEPKAEDFAVIANYTIEGEPHNEELEANEFTMTVKNDFYAVGGDIQITYKEKSETIHVDLIPVKLESLNIAQMPYNIKYQTGSTFNTDGLIVSATYNDGSTKVIPSQKYTVNTTKALTPADSSVSISYTEGTQTQTVAVPIGVVDVLNNGAVTALSLAGDAVVEVGDMLSNATMKVDAVYESGNRRPLNPSEYYVLGGDTEAKFGKAYTVSVLYGENTNVSLSTGVVVRTTLQGENGTIVGGNKKSEAEYAVVDGVITKLNNNVSFAGDFGKSVLSGKEGSLTLTVTSESGTVGNITMRCGNSYCCFANGTDDKDGYRMLPLKINTILTLTVNGREVAIPDNVVLKGTDVNQDFAPLYGIYYEFTFKDVELDPGVNTIKFKFKPSTAGVINCWKESPSTMNIDYVNFDTVGKNIPDNYPIEKIEFSPNYTISMGGKISDIKPPVITTLADGTRVVVPEEYFAYEISASGTGETLIKYGKYTVTAYLRSNAAVQATKDFEFTGFKILRAGIEQEGDKVYYVFSGEAYGYTEEDLVFFNEATMYSLITEFTGGTFTFKIDVTHLPTGTVLYPHLRVKGAVYANGANSNGDIRGNGLVFTDGQEVGYNGKTYRIVKEYEMPVLRIYPQN